MCGFIGVYGPEGVDVAPEIYEGLLSIQHRGQDAAGITTFTDIFHLKKGGGLVRDVFSAADMSRLRGNLGVGHVRYPTVGAGSTDDAQPFHVNFPIGVAMAHNGNVTNFLALRQSEAVNHGTRLNSSCDVEMILFVFTRALTEGLRPGELVTAEAVFRAVKAVYKQVKGAYSVIAALPDVGMVAFRDPYGIKPAVFGEKVVDGESWFAFASETVVLDVAGYDSYSDIEAGEVIFIDTERKVHRRQVGNKPHHPCIFELVYFARPDSMIDQVSVYKTRGRFGVALAQQWKDVGAPTPDVVIPIPDSSRDAALTMASALDLPYREGLVKNRYIGRTFIMANQKERTTSLKRKLNTIPLEFKGKDVLLVDDSIVRGNTSRQIIRMAREAGARKVYMGITSPPLVAPCPYGIDMASKTEFVATGRSTEEVAEALGADYLLYLDRDLMNQAALAGNPNLKHYCNACFTGDYPTGDITPDVLEAIRGERSESQHLFNFTP
ncbi:MAG: amidophosphoribosyltransferase [Planctomycetota bacterium]|jgi:amidophosphoribosyltransferase